MDRETRNLLERTTQQARKLLKEEFERQLEGKFDILPDGTIHAEPGEHLSAQESFLRGHLVAAIEHRRAQGESDKDSVAAFVRECSFTFLNRIVALRMLEAHGIIKPSVSKGEESSGFTNEFLLLAPGLKLLPDKGYRLYLESLFDEIGREVGVLFDRNDIASQLWPERSKFLELLQLLNRPDLAPVWATDEAIGWIYQYFNSEDERRQMRADSSAPQNSYEMAVRNQFFTPRYIVEFLTDNTLGRLWYEMRRGDTALKQLCRYMVRRPNEIFLAAGEESPTTRAPQAGTADQLLSEPVYVAYREEKDPREIRILDPACGSGHFLLYCFDLLEVIYEEAWGAGSGELKAQYPEQDQLKRAIPELILHYNLHGIDIDPRAAQICSLALWMRAQRSWKDILRAERPPIRKTNIAIAEPMPGEAELLDDFCNTLNPKLLGQLLREVFNRMKIAGDAGALLRIETDIEEIVAEARRQWLAEEAPTDRAGNPMLFAASRQRTVFEMERITADFWTFAEERLIAELRHFSSMASNGRKFQRKLFADDAERGFAFIDICRQRFAVMLMNPPFGSASLPSKDYVDQSYGDTKGDVYKAFVEGSFDRLLPAGMLGIISSRTGFFLTQSQDWRERVVLRLFRPHVLADLGEGVLDAMVETAAYAMRRLDRSEELDLTLQLVPALKEMHEANESTFSIPAYARYRSGLKRHQALQELGWLERANLVREIPGRIRKFELVSTKLIAPARQNPIKKTQLTCFRLGKEVDKENLLRKAIGQLAEQGVASPQLFVVMPDSFSMVPGSPFAYWVDDRIRALFRKFPQFESEGRTAKVGLQTSDDFRFVRDWWEVPADSLLTGKASDAPEDFRRRTRHGKRWAPFAKGGRFSPYYVDLHLVVNWERDGHEMKAWAGSLYNNSHWTRIVKNVDFYFRSGITWPRRTNGLSFRQLPSGCIFADKGPAAFITSDQERNAVLGVLNSSVFKELIRLQLARESLAQSFEVGLIQQTPIPDLGLTSVGQRVIAMAESKRLLDTTQEVSHVYRLPALCFCSGETLIDRIRDWQVRVHRDKEEMDRNLRDVDRTVAELYGARPSIEDASLNTIECDEEDDDQEVQTGDAAVKLTAELISHAVGWTFGRWITKYPLNTEPLVPLPGLFDPLPEWAPGASSDFESGVPMVVDEPGNHSDLVSLVEKFFIQVFGDSTDARLHEAGQILMGNDASIRDWLRNGFFEFHIRQYSGKPRKAPIYWQLSIPSRRYSVWLYYHRLNRDTLWRVLNDFVKPKLMQEERRLTGLRAEAGNTPTPTERKAIQEQESFVTELANFREDFESIAPLWNPNLNDGVLLNFAPLWKLVPQVPSWQGDLLSAWQKLCEAECEWAHIAMHLWPERVVPKCAKDRSLSIAHGLEEIFWEPQSDGKWKAKKLSADKVKLLIDERSSKTMKAAVDKLLTRPLAAPAPGRRRHVAKANS